MNQAEQFDPKTDYAISVKNPSDVSTPVNVRSNKLELLAPAKNLEYGQQAILHGADAVYIGGPAFGARASAGNSVEDIAKLTARERIQ